MAEVGETTPIRVGVVGCGRILNAHFRGIALLREAGFDEFRVTALVARNRDDALRFRKRGEGPTPRPPVAANPEDSLGAPHRYVSDFQPEEEALVYDSVEEMLASGTVDAVILTASLPVHHTIGVQVLQAGKHLMVEKPLAVSIRAGQALVDAAEAGGRSLGVMEMVRYAPPQRMARWALDRGLLGDVQMVAAVNLSTGEWSPDRVVADTPWRHRLVEAGGGPSIDIGVHIAHRLRYLVGEVDTMTAVMRTYDPQREVRDPDGTVHDTITADVDDAFFAIPEFALGPNGPAGMLSFTWSGHGAPTGLPGGLTLYGTRGSLQGTTLTSDDGTVAELADLFARDATDDEREAAFPRGVRDSFGLAYLDWARAIRHGGQPETSGADALKDLATAFAICEAAHARRPVRVADVLSGSVRAYQQPIDQHYGLD